MLLLPIAALGYVAVAREDKTATSSTGFRKSEVILSIQIVITVFDKQHLIN